VKEYDTFPIMADIQGQKGSSLDFKMNEVLCILKTLPLSTQHKHWRILPLNRTVEKLQIYQQKISL
jgi:hypothetical protein